MQLISKATGKGSHKSWLLLSFLLFVSYFSFASDLVEVTPLTDRIILLHFSDGSVSYSGRGEDESLDQFTKSLLDTANAKLTANWTISSSNDPNYSSAVAPLSIGRKSKPVTIAWNTDGEVLHHWVYVELPSSMQDGSTYDIAYSNLNTTTTSVSLTFDEFSQRSEAIHVNQLGYVPDAGLKYGYIAEWMGDAGGLDLDAYIGNAFHLIDASSSNIVFSGTIQMRRDLSDSQEDHGNDRYGPFNNFYGSDVAEADFSSFSSPGSYYLVVEGFGRSFEFDMAENIYRDPFQKVTKFLYLNRAGIAKTSSFTNLTVSRDHHPADGNITYKTTARSIDDADYSTMEAGEIGTAPGKWGWYHDAGDWDGYLTHFKIPLLLSLMYEGAPFNFTDGELNIPESGNGLPDVLDEAGWLLQYFRRDINPDGSVYGARVKADGHPAGKPSGGNSADDTRKWYAMAADPHTNFLFAACAANYAAALQKAGVSDSTAALTAEAEAAYTWAMNPSNQLNGDADKGVVFIANGLNDLQLLAAASLYKLTGNITYQNDFENALGINSPNDLLFDYNARDQRYGVWVYTTAQDRPTDNVALKSMLTQASYHYAQSYFLDNAKKRSGRVGYGLYDPPVNGATTTPNILEPYFAYRAIDNAQQRAELKDYMLTTADYFMGNNPLNTVWITGVGERHPTQALHLDSWYNESGIKGQVVDGIVPYGPFQHPDNQAGSGDGANWMTDADWPKIRSYPDRYSWPISEMWFDNRYTPRVAEFTVHQNSILASLAFGFLSSTTSEVNSLPTVSFTAPANNAVIVEGDPVTFTVNAIDDVSVDRVEYYISGNLIGESTTAPFSLSLPELPKLYGTLEVEAYAYDNFGSVSASPGVVNVVQNNQFGTSPYNNTPAIIPGSFPSWTFDEGANGVAYFDKDLGNTANNPFAGRAGTDVDIEFSFNDYETIKGNDAFLWNTEKGEWLTYTVVIEKDTLYDVSMILTNSKNNAKMSLILDDVDTLLNEQTIPKLGSWPHVKHTLASCINLPAGTHVLKFVLDLPHSKTRISDFIITESVRAMDIQIDQDVSFAGQVGKSNQMTASVLPIDLASCPAVNWYSLNTQIATIDASGVLTGVSVGQVDIVAESQDLGYTDTLTVFINPSVTINSPDTQTTYNVNDPIDINVSAFVPDSWAIDKVDFLNNNELIGSDNSSPYTLNYDVPAGTHNIKALVYYDQGAVAFDSIRVYGRAPFTEDFSPHPIPGSINFADYDHGNNDESYLDTTPGNSRGSYRQDDVDINSNGAELTNIAASEWLEYTVEVDTTISYDLNLSYGNGGTANAQVRFDIDGVSSGVIDLEPAGWWPPTPKSLSDFVTLTKGVHTIRVNMLSAPLNLYSFELTFPGSELMEVRPVTANTLVLHLDDGIVNLHGRGESKSSDKFVGQKLDVTIADDISNYSISSPDDPNYANTQSPLSIGRKSKRTEQGDNPDTYADEHWIYVEMPHAMQEGYTYQVSLDEVATNTAVASLLFDSKVNRSDAIHVNQIGYSPDAPLKYGYLAAWNGSAGAADFSDFSSATFHIIDVATGTSQYQGTLQLRKSLTDPNDDVTKNQVQYGPSNNYYGSDVYEANFSSFSSPGNYYLSIEGVGRSYEFEIAEKVYDLPFEMVTKFLYTNRAGIALEQPYTSLIRGRDHHPGDGNIVYRTALRSVDPYDRVQVEAQETGPSDVYGWYHDAGDWDGYPSHMYVPLALLSTFEANPNAFADGQLNIPESGNGLPDLLDEAAWLISYFRRNIDPDGSVYGARVTADGDALGKPVSGNSSDDQRKWYALAADPHTNFVFAALNANYAFALEEIGITDSTATLLAEAQAAYAWADNPANQLAGDSDKGMQHLGITLNDLKILAAASLYKLTGNAAYQTDFENGLVVNSATADLFSWGNFDQQWAIWTYLTAPDFANTNTSLKSTLKSAAINWANVRIIDMAKNRSSRMGGDATIPPIIGSTTTPSVWPAIFAHRVSENAVEQEEILSYIYTTADYFLGTNPLNMAWVTGLGKNHPSQALHLDSWYNEAGIRNSVVPGLVPYGPVRNSDWHGGDGDVEKTGQACFCPDDDGKYVITWTHDADLAKEEVYPVRWDWPVSEFWFNSRYSIADGEFTIHQNNAYAVGAYGYLASLGYTGGGGGPTIVDVDSVLVNPLVLNLVVDSAAQLNPTVYPLDATDQSVSWSTSDAAVATVDNAGLVTAVATGSVTITVTTTDGNFTANSTITVMSGNVAVTGVTLDQPALSIDEGQTAQLTETVNPTSATDQSVTWSSSDDAVATVDVNGLVTAVSAGTATITVTTNDGGFTSSSTLTVNALSGGGDTYSLIPLADTHIEYGGDANNNFGTITSMRTRDRGPTSSNTQEIYLKFDLSTVSGTVSSAKLRLYIFRTADNPTTVTLVNDDSWTETGITGNNQPTSFGNVVANYNAVGVDDQYFEITLTNADIQNEVDGDNTLSLKLVGSTNGIVGFRTKEHSEVPTLEVETTGSSSSVAVTSVTLDQSTLSMDEGQVAQLTETVNPTNATDQSVTWTSSDDAIAIVDVNGLVTAVVAGTATITVTTTDGGFTANTAVTVASGNVAVASVTLDQSTLSMDEGQVAQLTETVNPTNATDQSVTWSSSDDAVATVDVNGLVTAVAAGTATITVTTTDGGFTANTAVTVASGNVAVASVTLDQPTLSITEGQNAQLTETVNPTNATDQSVTWSSSDDAVATVDVNGLVTAVAVGTATITVTTTDGGFTTSSTVTVNAPSGGGNTYSLLPLADTHVEYGGDANDNFGTLTSMRTRNTGPTSSNTQEIYLKFDLSTVSGTISSAKLRMYIFRTANNPSTITLVNDDTWTETGITGNNQPTSFGNVVANYNAVGVDDQYFEITLTNADIQNEVDGDNILSLKLVGSTNGIVGFRTKEHSEVPTLEIETTGSSSSVAVTSVTLDQSTLSMDEGQVAQLTETVNPTNATDQSVTWTSSDASIATVDVNGLVTAISTGTATITVTTTDGGFTANSTVTVASNSLVHHWTFDNNTQDQIGNADATLLNGATYSGAIAQSGQSLDLTGSTNHAVSTPTIDLGDEFTITLWAYNLGSLIHQNYMIGSGSPGLEVHLNSYNSTNGVVWFNTKANGNNVLLNSGTNNAAANQWNHIAVTGDRISGQMKIYINGVEVASNNSISATADFNKELYFGAQGGGGFWNGFDGYLDEIKIYDAIRTATEISDEFGGSNTRRASERENAESSVLKSEVLSLYPNPVPEGGSVTIQGLNESSDVEITIMDLSGKIIYRAVTVPEKGLIELEANTLRPGTYMVKVMQDSYAKTFVIIQR